MSTAYTESNVYKVTRRNYRMRKSIGVRDPITGKHKDIILPKGEYKRAYLGFCEVCGRAILDGEHKSYHHWDNELPAMGIWVCYKCHKIIEGVDEGISELYLKKKAEIEKEYAFEQLAKIGVIPEGGNNEQ